MRRHMILTADDIEIYSGRPGENAIIRVELSQKVNESEDLKPGAVCPQVLEAELFTPGGNLHIAVDSDLTLFLENEDSSQDYLGMFTVKKVIRPSPNRYIITAYDRLCWLDRDLSEWLAGLDGWPYSLQTFAQMVCDACDLRLNPKYFTNGEWPVQRFTASKVTGRRLMQWVGEASCRFCRAAPDGEIFLDWYKETDIFVGNENYIFRDSLSSADYLTERIDKVQIRADSKDVGVVYGSGNNAYVITGNPLLACYYRESLQELARVLYEKLFPVRYNPCKVTVAVDAGVECGDILRIRDRNSREILMYVMKKTRCGQKDVLECTGNPRRDSQSGQSSYSIQQLKNKVLEWEKDTDGIWAENRDDSGKSASLELSVDGLKTKAVDTSALDDRFSVMEQRAEGFSLQVNGGRDAAYTFDEEGITIEKGDTYDKTRITEGGMLVFKNDNEALTANSRGVFAAEVQASAGLSVAGRCRFEKYNSSRVGCFWIGG